MAPATSIRLQLYESFNLSDPTWSEDKCQQLIATLSTGQQNELTSIFTFQATTLLARSLGLQGKYGAAKDMLASVKAEIDRTAKLPESSSPATQDVQVQRRILEIRYYLERGRVLNSSGSRMESVPFFKDATTIAQAAVEEFMGNSDFGHLQYLLGDALHMLAIVASTATERNAYAAQAMTLAENSTDKPTRQWAGALYNNLAWDRMDEMKYAEALELFRKAAVIRKEALDACDPSGKERDKIFTAWKIACWAVGHALMENGQEDEAIKQLEDLLAINADGPKIREDLAILYGRKGNAVAAVHAKKAFEFGLEGDSAKEMEKLIKQFS